MREKRPPVDCVIYDCDGVMFDSLEANGRLYNTIAVSTGRPPLTDDELRYCHTHTVFEAIHHISSESAEMEEKALAFFKKEVDFREFIVFLKMEPNLLEVLSRLKERNIKRAISTNRTTSMKYIMDQYSLRDHFDMVVTALDVAHPKPHPESVEKILTELGLKRENVLYVGDSEVDQQTAQSSGVRFIAYKNSEIGTYGSIEDHLSLIDFL